jgi:demethylmenaquinone methyltransferase/2-methoxy-6-polyprenyl-1,4-benzoquinol methylase
MQTLKTGWGRLVQFGFRLLYNELAFTYDAVSWAVSLGEWRAWGRAAITPLDAPPNAPILELAHGPGHLQMALRAAGYTPYGIDLSPYMGRIAAARLRRAGQPIRLARADAGRLPFPDSAFAGAVSTFPTAFILAPETLREAYRVLRPAGRLVIVPTAQLTSGGIAKRGIDLAYRLTGQSSSTLQEHAEVAANLPPGTVQHPKHVWETIAGRFKAAGFTLRPEMAIFQRSIAQVLIAQKG